MNPHLASWRLHNYNVECYLAVLNVGGILDVPLELVQVLLLQLQLMLSAEVIYHHAQYQL